MLVESYKNPAIRNGPAEDLSIIRPRMADFGRPNDVMPLTSECLGNFRSQALIQI
jgi:hypothetical protein